jgi:hypothetical protein
MTSGQFAGWKIVLTRATQQLQRSNCFKILIKKASSVKKGKKGRQNMFKMA